MEKANMITCPFCNRPFPAQYMVDSPIVGHICPECSPSADPELVEKHKEFLDVCALTAEKIMRMEMGGDTDACFELAWRAIRPKNIPHPTFDEYGPLVNYLCDKEMEEMERKYRFQDGKTLITCKVCGRPIPPRFMLEIPESEGHICPFCAKNSYDFFYRANGTPEYAVAEQTVDLVAVREYTEIWEAATEADPNVLMKFDEYMSLAAGMATNIRVGKFDADEMEIYEYLWAFQAENKFKRYIGKIANLEEEPIYEKLCELLVLPRPSLGELMPLVDFMIENTSADE